MWIKATSSHYKSSTSIASKLFIFENQIYINILQSGYTNCIKAILYTTSKYDGINYKTTEPTAPKIFRMAQIWGSKLDPLIAKLSYTNSIKNSLHKRIKPTPTSYKGTILTTSKLFHIRQVKKYDDTSEIRRNLIRSLLTLKVCSHRERERRDEQAIFAKSNLLAEMKSKLSPPLSPYTQIPERVMKRPFSYARNESLWWGDQPVKRFARTKWEQ
ncbi:hypothetical protein CEXT_687691 [Caerostris extrusa]|uniref:Uncharacterized protein n=1 Tax=Caerostris extrusa TaxID=172846 RepID=A0AAV4N1F1_CAEEX|nr:hypothetical protein CEXT_687691 [Caerostris extrusa]